MAPVAELPPGEQVVLLQCRPETVWSKVERTPAFAAGAGLMSWITGSVSAGAVAPGGAQGHSHGHSGGSGSDVSGSVGHEGTGQ